MDVEREVVDLYRCLLMRDHIGETCEGVVTALVGSGAYVTLDTPFVDVLLKHESMGPDHYEMAEDELSVVGARSGDTISLGDRLAVVIEDVAILRRQVLGTARGAGGRARRAWTPESRSIRTNPLKKRGFARQVNAARLRASVLAAAARRCSKSAIARCPRAKARPSPPPAAARATSRAAVAKPASALAGRKSASGGRTSGGAKSASGGKKRR